MNPIVLYKSKSGFAKTYAQWLAEELNCEAVPLEKALHLSLEDFNPVVYGGGVYAGKINGIAEFKKQLPRLQNKTIAVFATGALPEDSPQIEACLDQNLTPEERAVIKAFYFQGGLNYDTMPFMDKTLLKVLKKALKNKKVKTPEESGMLAAISDSFCAQTKLKITPLITYCQSTT